MDDLIAYIIIVVFYLFFAILKKIFSVIFNTSSYEQNSSDNEMNVDELLDFLKKHREHAEITKDSNENLYKKTPVAESAYTSYKTSHTSKANKFQTKKTKSPKMAYTSKEHDIKATNTNYTENSANLSKTQSYSSYIRNSTLNDNLLKQESSVSESNLNNDVNYDKVQSLEGIVNLEKSSKSLEDEDSIEAISKETISVVSPLHTNLQPDKANQLFPQKITKLKLKITKSDLLKSIILSEILKPYKLSNAINRLPFNKSDNIL